MKAKRDLLAGLVLAGVMALSMPALAQNQGKKGNQGVCPVGQGNQMLCTGGPGGTCAVNPPPKAQNCPRYGAGQGQRGPKGPQGGRMNQPAPQANPGGK